MGDIHNGRRIIGQHGQDIAWRKRFQPLAGLQYGQGAEEANGVQGRGLVAHGTEIIPHSQPVHKDVTAGPRDLWLRLV